MVPSRPSRDADWFERAVFRSRALASTFFSVGIMEKHEIMFLACQVGPFHLMLTQTNSGINRPLAHRGNAANLGGKTNEIFSSGN